MSIMSALDAEIGARLLKVARAAIEDELLGRDLRPAPIDLPPDLPNHGVFVTLRRGNRLRGCIGTFRAGSAGLAETVQAMAAAATADSRFDSAPLSAAEMPSLSIELSILSPLIHLADPLSLQVGTHGVYIRRGESSGCFLPEVASERGWDAETFLSACCAQKAGLPADAWTRPDTEVFVFTVQKFLDDPARGGTP